MKHQPTLNKIAKVINNNFNASHIIILPKSFSKNLVKKLIRINCENNFTVSYIDDYVFNNNKINKDNLFFDDIKYFEEILSETKSFFNQYNLTQETENIINIMNDVCLDKNLYIKNKNTSIEDTIKKFDNILLSHESKIIYEILKLLLTKAKTSSTYINTYLSFLNYEDNKKLNNNIAIHIINFENFSDIEKKWLKHNSFELYKYMAYSSTSNINHDNFIPNNLNKYSTMDFNTQEEELEFLANDIVTYYETNKLCKIALINNDRYFARRLRALLERKNIKINDISGWLLSTSTCCSYINSILNYFIYKPSYIDLFDIIMSPYFMPNIETNAKNKYLNSVFIGLKNNINITLNNFQHKHDSNLNEYKIFDRLFICDEIFEYNNDKKLSFSEFKIFLESKISKFKSREAIVNDDAGKKFYEIIDYISSVNHNNKFTLALWYKKLVYYLENKTFYSENKSNIYFTDINHSLLFSFDKIYISAMSEKNYPKKIINNFSINNSVYSDYSISSNKMQTESIEDFLSVNNNANQILLTSHFSNNDEIYSKSKFKRYIDHYLTSSSKNHIKKIIKKEKNKEERLILDNSFRKLSFKDIENYNNCYYCFYFEKQTPRIRPSKISTNHNIFGLFAHYVLDAFIKKYNSKNNKLSIINILEESTYIAEKKFFLEDQLPYEMQLWRNLLPNIAEYFYLSIDKKYNFKSEDNMSIIYSDMQLVGRCDLIYSIGNDKYVVDYKTGSAIPTRKSVTEGQLLQLPFYTILNSNITTAFYMFLNIYTKKIKHVSFSYDDLEEARSIIFTAIDNIKKNIINKNFLLVEKSVLGCNKCGYQDLNRPD